MRIINLSEVERLPKHCYIIIDDMVMEFDGISLEDSYEVSGESEYEKAESFEKDYKKVVEKMPRKIYYDDTGMYSADVIEDLGYLTDDFLDGADEEEREDWNSYAEYCAEH